MARLFSVGEYWHQIRSHPIDDRQKELVIAIYEQVKHLVSYLKSERDTRVRSNAEFHKRIDDAEKRLDEIVALLNGLKTYQQTEEAKRAREIFALLKKNGKISVREIALAATAIAAAIVAIIERLS